MTDMDLDQLADAITDRQRQKRFEETGIPRPPEPQPGSISHEIMVAHERRRKERLEAARRLAEEQAAMQRAEEARREAAWDEAAPERNRAERELPQLRAELDRLDAERGAVVGRLWTIRRILDRNAY